MSFDWIEWVGYIASILVAISLTMTSIRRLRWINLIGSIVFAIYGALLSLYPVLIVNTFIAGVNIYYLLRNKLTTEHFHLIPISWDTSIFLPRFIQFYLQDIQKLFPEVTVEELRQHRAIFITRNVVPVGLFIYERQEGGVIKIHLDYEIPIYRDYESAHFFFGEFRKMVQKKGFHTYVAYCHVPTHQRYLRRMKFKEDPAEPGRFVREI